MLRRLDPGEDSLVALVADRMRLTLVEVVGAAEGEEMYSRAWLVERVRWHLDPARTAAVFVAEDDGGGCVGHTIIRAEDDARGGLVGLFSTTWIAPEARRRGTATALLRRGEAWMREQGLSEAWTHTAEDNAALIALYEREGYRIVLREDAMVRLAKCL